MNPIKWIFRKGTAPVKKSASIFKELGGVFKKSKGGDQKNKTIVIGIVMALLAFFIMYITPKLFAPKPRPPKETTALREVTAVAPGEDAFVSGLGEKGVIVKMEQEDSRLQQEINGLKTTIRGLEENVIRLKDIQKELVEKFNGLDTAISKKVIMALRSEMAAGKEIYPPGEGPGPEEMYEGSYVNVPLKVYDVAPLKTVAERKTEGDVYLPIGSFVTGTLLSGVYAPIDGATPLPVLISINHAFFGPNNSKIPLEGALSIGKATGNATSERAHIQVSKMSVVMPDGKVFEKEGNLGFIVGADDSALALKGKLITKTKEQIEASFYSGVFAGAGAALERGQITQYAGPFGQTTTAEKATALQIGGAGFRQAFSRMADYQIKQLEKMVDAIYIAPGREVYIVMTEGVKIEGMQVGPEAAYSSSDYID